MKKRNLTVMRMLSVTMISAVLGTGVSAPLLPVQAAQAAETTQAPGAETDADTPVSDTAADTDVPSAREGEVKALTVTAVDETYGTENFTVTVSGEGSTVSEGVTRSYEIIKGADVIEAATGEGAEGKFNILKAGTAEIKVTDTAAAAENTQAKEGEGTIVAEGTCNVTISPKEITAAFSTNPTDVNIEKTYDGSTDLPADSKATTDAWVNNFKWDDLVEADKEKLDVSITYAFEDKNAAENKKIVATVQLADKDSSDPVASNYTLAADGKIEISNSGAITAKELTTATVAGKNGAAITKEYDGKTEVAADGLQNLQISFDAADIVAGDTVSAAVTDCNFADKAVGTGKKLEATIGTLDNNNYKLAAGLTKAEGTGEITAKALTATVTGTAEKEYDGTTAVPSENGNSLGITLAGVVDGETVTVDNTKVQYSFADKAAGENKKVTAQVPAEALGGESAANYKLAEGEIAGDAVGKITQKELTPKLVMDGTLTKYFSDSDNDKKTISPEEAKAAGLHIELEGICGQDEVTASASYEFAEEKESENNPIKATAIELKSGADKDNYSLSATTLDNTNVTGSLKKTKGTELTVTVTEIDDAEYGDELAPADIESHITRNTANSIESTGILSFEPAAGSDSVLKVTADGNIKIKGTGTAKIAFTIAADAEYAKAEREITVTASARKLTPKVVFNAEKAPVKYVGEDAAISTEEAEAAGLKIELYDKNGTAVSEEEVTAGTPSFAFSDTSAAGETTIKATNLTLSDSTNYAWADGVDVSNGIESEDKVQVKEPVAIDRLSFQDLELDANGEASVQLNVGGELTLTPVAEPAEAEFTVTSWVSDKTNIATVTDGTVTAVAEGTAKITVTVKERGANGEEKTAVCNVEVVGADTLTKVEITGLTDKKLSLPVGGEAQLETAVTPEGLEGVAYTWESEDASIAEVDQAGKVTAVAAGTAKITVTAQGADGKGTATDWCTVEVTNEEVAVTGITLDKTALELTSGSQAQLTATVEPENATNRSVTWSSSDESVATVADGKVTAVVAGTAQITASCGGRSAVCTVTVKDAGGQGQDTVAVTGITLDQESLQLKVGGTAKLNAAVEPENASNKTIIWSSSDEKIVTVDAQGTVTAVAAGSAVITATSEANSEITKTCSVTVTTGSSSGSSSGGSSSGGSSSGGSWGGSYGGGSGSTGSGNTGTKPGTTTPGTTTPGTTTPGTTTPGTTTPGTAQKPAPENKVIANVKEQPDGTFINGAGETVTNAIVQTADGTKYITDQTGQKMKNSVVTTTDGTMYCTKADGAVARSQTVTLGGKKYFAKADGVVARDEFCETKYGNTVYAKADGTLAVNTTIKVDGSKYFAKKSGAIAKGEFCTTPAGSTVYAEADGTLATDKVITVSSKKYFAKKSGAIAKKAFSTTAK
ncbi:MAG: Ig-like domain-containing protein [Eubacterium sp.]|nr:Ig-like domain-containing protein [Eubacterium sp.]